ncbi:MAG: hypothetical protein R2820_07230 [Cyclobacteriaceae bacterium]
MTTDIETKFIDSIDCKFPYQDKEKCIRLIDEAAGISVNAIFSVVEEICRVPVSAGGNVEISYLTDLLEYTQDKFDHPIKDIVFDTSDKLIHKQELTVDEAIDRMEIVRMYQGQFAALSILYFSCDDIDGRLEPIWDDIIQGWKK